MDYVDSVDAMKELAQLWKIIADTFYDFSEQHKTKKCVGSATSVLKRRTGSDLSVRITVCSKRFIELEDIILHQPGREIKLCCAIIGRMGSVYFILIGS